jgi:hypothetical protein
LIEVDVRVSAPYGEARFFAAHDAAARFEDPLEQLCGLRFQFD